MSSGPQTPAWVIEAFESWVHGWGWETSDRFLYLHSETVEDVGPDDEEWPATQLLGKLWHCGHPMSEDMCDRLNMPLRSTYAAAAQWITSAGKRGKFLIPRSAYRVPPP